jgi:hypothetical protein
MRLVFRGGEADRNRIDLFNGAEALASIGRIGNLVSHYVSTGTVRFRGPYDDSIQYVLSGVEPGSFAAVIQGVTRLGAEVRAAAKISSAGKLLSRVIRRGTGGEIDGDLETENGLIPEEDIDVLVEASEPALKRMHSWIDQTDKSILIEPDGTRSIKLDEETKAYLQDEDVDPRRSELDVSVAAININNQTGRVFIPQLSRTVPFRVPSDAHPRTLPNLSRYVVKYADRKRRRANFEINAHIIYKNIKTSDGRVKRLLIYDCEPLDELI